MMTQISIIAAGGRSELPGLSTNVSYGGMAFYLAGQVQPGDEVTIKITYSPNTDSDLIEEVTGVVRWCKPMNQWYAMGVQFIDLEPDRQPLLYAYIESALRFHHLSPQGKGRKAEDGA